MAARKHDLYIRFLPLAFTVGLFTSVVAQAQQAAAPARAMTPVAAATTQQATTSFQERDPRYRIRRGDSFDIDFTFSPEFNQTVAVQPDGYVTLKGVGSVRVANQTVPEATDTIKAAYAQILHEPAIAIVLKDFEKPFFIAGGQVARPGKYELRSDTTLTEAVAIAGGFTDSSKHSQVLLFRRVSDQMAEARVFNLKQMVHDRSLREDIYLQPGDLIVVPQNTVSKLRRFIPTSSLGLYANPMP